VDGISFGGSAAWGPGIAAARDLLGPMPAAGIGRRAMVLLSDGFDVGAPGALTVAATLPPGLAVHTCALGHAADADRLEQLAGMTGGRFFYAPDAQDLFETYNFIRASVSGEGLVANQTGTAGADVSAVGAFVDALAETATFCVAWTDPNPAHRFVTGPPAAADEIRVRLVAPGERWIHPSDSSMRRTVGPGFVIFHVEDPPAGAWRVEIESGGGIPIRYTVGAFLRSPLRLVLDLQPRRPQAGAPLTVHARVFDGAVPLNDVRAVARFSRPRESLAAAQARLATAMANVTIPTALTEDGMAEDLARLLVLRREIVAAGGADPLRRRARRRALRELRGAAGAGVESVGTPPAGASVGSGSDGSGTGGPAGTDASGVSGAAGAAGTSSAGMGTGGTIGTVGASGSSGTLGLGVAVGTPLGGPVAPMEDSPADGRTGAPGRTLGASFSDTRHPGCYVVRVDAAGVSEHSGARFSRVDMIATVVGG
jgi:hypothetical protein